MNKPSRRQHLITNRHCCTMTNPQWVRAHAPSTPETERSSFELIDAVLAAAGEVLTTQHQASMRHHLPEDAAVFARYGLRLEGIRTALRMDTRAAPAPTEPAISVETSGRAFPSTEQISAEPSWVVIPPSEVWLFDSNRLGATSHTRRPAPRRVEIPAFRIARHLVTKVHYQHFLNDTGHPAPPHWEHACQSAEEDVHPVTNVSGADAEAFCAWLTEILDSPARLPDELEWHQAAYSRQILPPSLRPGPAIRTVSRQDEPCKRIVPPVHSDSSAVRFQPDGMWEWVNVLWHTITRSGYGLRSLMVPYVDSSVPIAHSDCRHQCVGFRPVALV